MWVTSSNSAKVRQFSGILRTIKIGTFDGASSLPVFVHSTFNRKYQRDLLSMSCSLEHVINDNLLIPKITNYTTHVGVCVVYEWSEHHTYNSIWFNIHHMSMSIQRDVSLQKISVSCVSWIIYLYVIFWRKKKSPNKQHSMVLCALCDDSNWEETSIALWVISTLFYWPVFLF